MRWASSVFYLWRLTPGHLFLWWHRALYPFSFPEWFPGAVHKSHLFFPDRALTWIMLKLIKSDQIVLCVSLVGPFLQSQDRVSLFCQLLVFFHCKWEPVSTFWIWYSMLWSEETTQARCVGNSLLKPTRFTNVFDDEKFSAFPLAMVRLCNRRRPAWESILFLPWWSVDVSAVNLVEGWRCWFGRSVQGGASTDDVEPTAVWVSPVGDNLVLS